MSRNSEPTRRGRPRDARVDAAILDAALALFASGGREAVTFEGVATRAAVGRSAVYRRWSDRDALVVAALVRTRERGERGAEGWEASDSLATVIEMFRERAIRALSDRQSTRLLGHVFVLDHDSPIRQAYWASIVWPRRLAFARLIDAARERGEIAAGPSADLLQDLLAGALAYRSLVHPEPLAESEAGAYVDDVLRALGLRPGPQEPGAQTG